jgi:hypothetical protein
MTRALGLTILFLFSILLSGCPKRIDFGPGGEVRTAEELLKAIDAVEAQVVSVQGEAKLKADSPQTKGVVTLFAAVTQPGFVHLESLNFFGKPEGILISDGREFGLFQVEQGTYHRGPASAQNLAQFVPVPLHPLELAALLLGRSIRIAPEQAELSIDESAGSYLLVLRKGPVTQKLWVHPSEHRVLKSEVTGARAYDYAFDKLETKAGVSLPMRVTMSVPSQSLVLELTYKDVEVNKTLEQGMFDLSPPPNAKVIEVDAEGNAKPL